MSTCKPMNVSGKVMDEQTDTLRTAYDMCTRTDAGLLRVTAAIGMRAYQVR